MYARIVKHHKCFLVDTHRQSVKKVCNLFSPQEIVDGLNARYSGMNK